jgi:hypothetical protein
VENIFAKTANPKQRIVKIKENTRRKIILPFVLGKIIQDKAKKINSTPILPTIEKKRELKVTLYALIFG